MVEITDRDSLKDWLDGRERADAVAIAARAALRALPLTVVALRQDAEKYSTALILPCCRASSISWVAAIGPTHDIGAAAAAAAAAATTTAAAATYAAAAAAYAAAAAAATTTAAAATTTAAAAATYAAAAATFWKAVSSDVTALDQGINPATLIHTLLWPQDAPAPVDLTAAWSEMRALLLSRTDEDWGVWTDWYDARIKGGGPINPALETARVLIPNKTWEQGPKAVNTRIRELIIEHTPKPKRRSHLTIEEAVALIDQSDRGFKMRAMGNHLALDAEALGDLDQIEADLPMIRMRADDLVNAFAGANDPCKQRCARDAKMFKDIVDCEPEQIAKQARNLWNLSIGLGSMYERDTEELKLSDYGLLSRDQRTEVDIFLSTSANFVRLFPAVRKMDSEDRLHRGIEHRQALTVKLIESSVDHNILLRADADILLALAQIASEATKQSPKAAAALDHTGTNMLKQIMWWGAAGAGAVTTGALSQVGVNLEAQLELTKHSIEFIMAAENDIRAAIGSLPADIRAPMRHALDAVLQRDE